MYTLQYQNSQAIYTDHFEQIQISIPRENSIGLAQLQTPPPIANDAKHYRHILDRPSSGAPLQEIVRAKQATSACVLVSDASRKVPTSKVAPHIIDTLLESGIATEHIVFFVATGVHREASTEEMREMIGEKYWGKVRILNHTPYQPDNIIHLGITSRGTPIEVNAAAYACDLHIAIGKVEPHEFAGFSGGRKSVLPGISSEKTIAANHAPQMLNSEFAQPGILENNPIHLDMLEAAEHFHLDFSVNFIVNASGEPVAVFAGAPDRCHIEAVRFLHRHGSINVQEKPDILVTTPGVPLNLDFYQSIKPLIALTNLVDKNTAIALYSLCSEGIQSPDMMEPFQRTTSLADMVEYATENYRVQMDHSLLLAKVLKKAGEIYIHSPNVEDQDISSMYMHPCKDAQTMVLQAIRRHGKRVPRVLFVPAPQRGLVCSDCH